MNIWMIKNFAKQINIELNLFSESIESTIFFFTQIANSDSMMMSTIFFWILW